MTDAEISLPHIPRVRVDLDAVNARYRDTLTASPGHASRTALVHCVADIPALVSEVERLYALVLDERRRHANLTAAARATLSAAAEREGDPLAYLRDELTHGGHPGSGRGRR